MATHPEKLYYTFFGLISDNLLPNHFNHACDSNTLLHKVANDMLQHLSDVKEKLTPVMETTFDISNKEIKCLHYLAGFVIHKLYKKFKFSKKEKDPVYNFQCCLILRACQVETDVNETLVNVRDRGGLWRANPKIIDLFVQWELLFRSRTSVFFTSLSTKDFVVDIMTNIIVRSNFNSVCMSTDNLVSQEIQKNVLEQMITLFVCVRTFSFAKSTRERHKIAKKESRKRSLRTEIKKLSTAG